MKICNCAKKYICMLTVMTMVFSTFLITDFKASAAQNDFFYFYDFNDYTAGETSGVGPDSKWQYVMKSSKYGSFDTGEEEYGRALKVVNGGEPSLFYDHMVTDGKLHISFDAKLTAPTAYAIFYMWDGHVSGIPSEMNPSKLWHYKALALNQGTGEGSVGEYVENNLCYYTSPMAWTKKDLINNFTSTEWHHFDIVTGDITSNRAMMSYYVDGEFLQEQSWSISKGFYTMSFRGGDAKNSNGALLVDNLSINHFYGDEELTISQIGSNKVELNDGYIDIAVSEKVDKELLTKENIKLKDVTHNEEINNFEITNVTNNRFTINFNGEIMPGKYSIMLDSKITGLVSKSPQKNAFEFKTSYKYESVFSEFYNDNFNDYTASDGTLPNGFINYDGVDSDNTYSKSLPGYSQEENDFSFGFENMPVSRTQTRFLNKFSQQILKNSAFEIEFDAYSLGTSWYMYIPFSGDFNVENADYKQNTLLMQKSNGSIWYSTDRRVTPNQNFATYDTGVWRHYYIKIEPDIINGSTHLKIVIDGDEYNVDTSAEFCEKNTAGIGFGYRGESSSDAMLKFDNVKVSSLMQRPYPDVEAVSCYDYDGNAIEDLSVGVSTHIEKAVVDFNTNVKDTAADMIYVLKNGNSLPVNIHITSNDTTGKSNAEIYFDGELDELSEYEIVVPKGILSLYSDELLSLFDYSFAFTTNRDNSVKVFDNGYEGSEASITFSKNTDTSVKYIYAVCEYKSSPDNVDIMELINYKSKLIILSENDTGIFKYTVPFSVNYIPDLTGEVSVKHQIKTYLWEYPSLNKVTVDNSGVIQ